MLNTFKNILRGLLFHKHEFMKNALYDFVLDAKNMYLCN
jgi:hypothetical protein